LGVRREKKTWEKERVKKERAKWRAKKS